MAKKKQYSELENTLRRAAESNSAKDTSNPLHGWISGIQKDYKEADYNSYMEKRGAADSSSTAGWHKVTPGTVYGSPNTQSRYDQYRNAADYGELSKATGSKKNEKRPFRLFDVSTWNRNGDDKYDFINDIDNYRDVVAATSAMASQNDKYGAYQKYSELTPDEIGMYNYIYAKEGMDAANEYLDYLDRNLNERYSDTKLETLKEGMDTLPTPLAAAISVIGQPAETAGGIIGAVDLAAQNLRRAFTGEAVDPNSRLQTASKTLKGIRGNVSEQIREDTDFEIAGENVAGFLYDTAMSGLDSYMASGMFGKAENATKWGKRLRDLASTSPLMANAFTSAAQEAYERGATDDQALKQGIAAAAAESIFESVSIGKFKSLQDVPITGLKSMIRNIATSVGVNFTEELFTEVANIVFDSINMGEKSNYSIAQRNYIADGMSPEEAKRAALGGLTKQALVAGAGGALMGGAFGMLGNAASDANARAQYRSNPVDRDALLSEVTSLPESKGNASLRKLAQDIVEGNKKASDTNMGRVMMAYKAEQAEAKARAEKEAKKAQKSVAKPQQTAAPAATTQQTTSKPFVQNAQNQPVTASAAKATENTTAAQLKSPEAVATANTSAVASVTAQDAADRLRTSLGDRSGFDEVYFDEDDNTVTMRIGAKPYEVTAAAASAMAEAYDGQTNAVDYVAGFNSVYSLAAKGMSEEKIRSGASFYGTELTSSQFAAAYAAGRNIYEAAQQQKAEAARQADVVAAQARDEVRTAEIEKRREEANDPNVKFDSGVHYIGVDPENLSRSKKAQFDVLDRICKRFGITMIVDEGLHVRGTGDMRSSDDNGVYNSVTGRIHVNVNAAAEGFLIIGHHELLHRIKHKNRSGYNTLRDLIFSALREQGEDIDALIKYQMDKFGYSKAVAEEEVIANSLPAILADEAYVKRIVEADRTLAEQIRDFFNEFVAAVNDALDALQGTGSWKQLRALRKDRDTLSAIAKVFEAALEGTRDGDGSGENVMFSKEVDDIISDTTDGITEMPEFTFSAKTLEENQLKANLSEKQAEDLDIPYTIEKVGRNGKTGVFATTLDITEAVMRKNGYSGADTKRASNFLKRVSDYLTGEAIDGYRYVGLDDINNAKIYIDHSTGKVLLSCRVKNGEYDVNFDFTKVCKKREAMQRFIDDLARTKGRQGGETMLDEINLSPENIFKMNTILKDAGYETACLGCFVEAKRYNIRSWAETIVSDWNQMVLERDPNAGYFGFATGDTNVENMSRAEVAKLDEQLRKYSTKGTSSAVERMPKLIDSSDSMLKLLRVSDLITTQGRTALHEFSSELESIVASRFGTASPKSVEAFTPYNSEIALLPAYKKVNGKRMSMADYLKSIAGVRSQSFSDFIITHVLDHLQKTVDLAARRFTAHTYTKEVSRAKLFGMSGEKINMSVMFDIDRNVSWEYAGLDENSNYIVGDSRRANEVKRMTGVIPFTQSIDFEEAVALEHDPRYSKNVGIIGVGYSYHHILKMLRDGDIPYVIAYHRSGLPSAVAVASNVGMATDYTPVQNTLAFKVGAQFSKVNADADAPSYATWNASKDTSASDATFDLKAELRKTGNPQGTMANFLSFMDNNSLTPNTKKKSAGHGSFDLYGALERTNDPKKAADEYIAWCIENDSLPLLYEFAAEENYWKLLFDFSVVDLATGETAVQKPVSMDWLKEMGVEEFIGMVDEYMKVYNEYRGTQFGAETESDRYAETKEKVYSELHFSMKDTTPADLTAVQEENESLNSALRLTEEFAKLIKGHKVSKQYVRNVAELVLKDYKSSYDLDTLAENVEKIFGYLATAESINTDEVNEMGASLMKAVIEKSQSFDKESYEVYATVRKYLRETSITLSDDQRSEAADIAGGKYSDYRKSLFGKVRLTNDGMPLGTVWQELSGMNSELFPADTNASDMPRVLLVAAESLKRENFYRNEYAYDLDTYAADAWTDMVDRYTKSVGWQGESEQVKALAEQLRKAQAEARKNAKAYAAAVSRIPKAMAEGIALGKARAERRYMRHEQSLKKQKYRARIEKKAKELSSWLVHPTDKKHVPESLRNVVFQFLETLEFSGSKQAEQWQLRMYKLKDFMARIEQAEIEDNNGQDIYLNIESDYIRMLEEFIVGSENARTISEMTDEQLKELDYLLGILKRAVTEVNKIQVQGRTQEISDLSESIIADARTKKQKIGGNNAFSSLIRYGNIKPIYFFKNIGGAAKILFDDIREGQNRAAFGAKQAKEFFNAVAEKYNAGEWLNKKRDVLKMTNARGIRFELTRQEALSLYATYKRELANRDTTGAAHLALGGFVFANEQNKTYDGEGKEKKRIATFKDATPKVMSEADMAKVIEWLTDEQKAFADELVGYMSTTLAAAGNAASLKMSGYKKFAEGYYFPYKSTDLYLKTDIDKANGTGNRLKNMGAAKATQKGAKNAIVIDDFTKVWGNHVEDMMMYAHMAIPQENLLRVFNYKTSVTDENTAVSVKSELQKAYGKGAVDYVNTLLRDLGGSIVRDPRESYAGALVSKFKKGAVLASFSVAIQQPSAILRAFALIDPKYFATSVKEWSYKEAMQYAGTAVIKEIGGFDTGTGHGLADWITSLDKRSIPQYFKAFFARDSELRDKVFGLMPSLLDKVTWAHIWSAVKTEVAAEQGLDYGSEEHLIASGKRFNDVIDYTQVYDSVLARSDIMRSKSSAMQMATSFMAEPTVSYNMLYDAVTHAGDKNYAEKVSVPRATAAFVTSVVLNSILKSTAYALRDDDEDQTLFEKYVESLTGSILGQKFDYPGAFGWIGNVLTSELSVAGQIPYVRDVISLFEGYDVERADMSLIGDLATAVGKLDSDTKTPYEKVMGIADALSAFLGLPVKNVRRDVEAVLNTMEQHVLGDSKIKFTWSGLLDAFKKGLGIEKSVKTETELLYNAFRKGNDKKRDKAIESISDLYQKKVDGYIRGGMSRSEAEKEAAAIVKRSCTDVLKTAYQNAPTLSKKLEIRSLALRIRIGKKQLYAGYDFERYWDEE